MSIIQLVKCDRCNCAPGKNYTTLIFKGEKEVQYHCCMRCYNRLTFADILSSLIEAGIVEINSGEGAI